MSRTVNIEGPRGDYRFCCPLCDTTADSNARQWITEYERDHMTNVHGGPYTAADDLAQAQAHPEETNHE